MKREYSRPSIHVESMMLDTAIASTNCTVSREDLNALQRWGYFAPELVCGIIAENLPLGNDTVCYHSNVRTVLTS
jgi:hypothetical protein